MVSLVFLVIALREVRLDRAWEALLGANYWSLIPALALYFTGVLIRAFRWRILLRPVVPSMTVYSTFKIVVIGYMANDVLPARIGELVRAYVISKKEKVRKTATLATIFVERIFDGLIMVGFAAAVVLLVTVFEPDALMTGEGHNFGTLLSNQSGLIAVLAVLLLGALLVFVAIASSRTRAERALRLVLDRAPGRLRERGERLANSFIDGLGSLRSASGLIAVFGLSIVAWLFEATMYYVLGTWGFNLVSDEGQALPFYVYVLVTAFVNLGTLVPQAPGFAGVFEAIAMLVLVGGFGVNENSAISYVLVLHVALLLPVTALGFFYLWRESLSWKELTGLEKTRAEAAEQAHELEGPLTDIELAQDDIISMGDPSAERELEAAGEEDQEPRRPADGPEPQPGGGGPKDGLDPKGAQPRTIPNPTQRVR